MIDLLASRSRDAPSGPAASHGAIRLVGSGGMVGSVSS